MLAKNPVPLFLALPLLLAPIASSVFAPRQAPTGRVRWRAAGSGPSVDVRGEIEIDGSVSARDLSVNFFPSHPLEAESPPELRTDGRSVRFRLRYRTPYPCLVPLPRPEVVWRDPLGLVEAPVEMEGSALRIERFPPEVARIGAVRLRRTTSSPGEVGSRTVGPTGEFFAVRASVPGDTPRQINWWATARSGRLLANDYLLERTGDLLIVLDARPTPLGPERDQRLLSVARAAAFGIATGFLDAKSRVGLGVFDEFLTAVPLGSGRLQRYRIRQALQRATLSEVGGPAERLAVSLRRYFSPGVTTLLISPLANPDSALLLNHLRRRGFSAFVLSPSPTTLLGPKGPAGTPEASLMLRLLALSRRHQLSELWREAPIVEWRDFWSLTPLLNYLSAPARAGRGTL